MNNIIRDGVNYGELQVCELDGIEFIVRKVHLDFFKDVQCVDKEIPQFNTVIRLVVTGSMTDFGDYEVYLINKQDIRQLAAALSKKYAARVRAAAHARFLAMWLCGVLVNGPRPLSEFYCDLTQQEIEETTF